MPELAKLLPMMLEFNPSNRLSCTDLLRNLIFDDIRNLDLEKPSKFKIRILFDKPEYYNYEDMKEKLLNREDYLQIFQAEYEKIKNKKVYI